MGCSSRMAKRGRPEEQGVTIDYLNQLHEKHEAWLHRREFSNENIMSDIPILEIDLMPNFTMTKLSKRTCWSRCEISSKSCRRRSGPKSRKKLRRWTIQA